MPFDNILEAVLIVVGFWILSFFATAMLRIVEKFASKTKSSLDDTIFKSLRLPIRYLFIILGLLAAVEYNNFTYQLRGFSIDDIFSILFILLSAFTLSRVLKTFFIWYGGKQRTKRVNKTMFIFIRKVSSVIVYGFALVMILGEAGVEVGPLIAGLGVAGLAIALGLQETLANLFAALFLVMDKSVNIGDYIKLEDGTKAYIEDISWRTVRIRTIGGNSVIVPNNVFAGQKIESFDYPESPMYTSVLVGVAYGSDLDKVEEIAIAATNKVIKDQEVEVEDNNPLVRFKSFGESSIDISVIIKVASVLDESRVNSALVKQIAKDFNKNNIEIPFPQRVIITK